LALVRKVVLVRVGLVLGAGGVLGGAWLVGGLRALERVTGWTGHRADLVVGTSSGALIGALITAGIPASDLLSAQGTRIMAEVVAAEGVPGLGVDLLETIARYRSGWAATAPGSWPLARAELQRPRPRHLLKVVSGLLPAGSVSTSGIQALVRRWAPEGWPVRPRFRVVACDYQTGERVAFGRAAPPELARAVGASCAMPSYYRPVLIGGRAFVDQRTTLGRIVAGGRRQLSRRLEREAALVRATGTPVLVLEPTVDDLIARGERRRTAERVDALARLAERTVAQQLARPANRVLVDRLRAHQPLHEIA
jgi:hypothetical protein